jgi:two-component system cell cycle sensor histidine kinase/response regulator CckA
VADPLRILFIEDVPADAELAERELRRGGLEFTPRRVETRDEYLAAIETFRPDVIVSDYRLPHFNGIAALTLALEIVPEVPFIITTGSLNEETAVECMKAGAWDYILKDRLSRLPMAIRGALDLARARAEERRALEALQRSEVQQRAFFDASADGVFVKDAALRTIMANQAYASLLGRSRADLLGRDDFDLMPEETARACRASDLAALAEARPLVTEEAAFGRTFETRKFVVPLADGTVGLGGFVRDVTQRQADEAALRERERQLRAIFDLASVGLAQADPETGQYLRVNRKMCEITGYEEAEMLEMRVRDVTHPDDREIDWDLFQRVGRGDAPGYRIEKRYVRKDGGVTWVNVNMTVIRDGDGRAVRSVAAIEDIDERKRVQRALAESEARYRLIAENTADVIWMLDLASRRFTYVSPSVKRLRGFTPEEVMAQPFDAALTPEALRAVDARLSAAIAALAAGDRSAETALLEIEQPTKNGGVVPTEVVATALSDVQGRVTGVLGVTRDITERRRAEEALRESEERYRALFDQSPIGIYKTTPDGRILLANPALLTMLGYDSLTELESRNLEEGGYEPDYPRQRFKELIERNGSVRGLESVWIAKDGRRVHVRENAHAIREPGGEVLYYEGTVEDVTASRAAEEALRRTEAQYRSLFEHAEDALLVFEPATEMILDANPKACELYGFDREELVGTSLKALTFDVTRGEEIIASLLEGRQVPTFETAHLRRAGAVVHLQVSASIVDFLGTKAILSAARDITRQREAEEARRRLATAIEQAAEVVIVTDRRGGIEYVNPAFERITGYSREEAIGKNPRILKSGKHDARFYRKLWDTIASGDVWSGRLTNRRKDGTLYEEEATISPVRDASGAIVNFVAVKRDITREAALQEQLNHAQRMEAVGTLAGGIAHDFNNVLQAMLSHIQLARATVADAARAEENLREIEEQVRRGAALTRQLLLFSRRETMKVERLDLNEVVRSAASLVQRLLPASVSLVLELADGTVALEADRGQLDQILINLAVNASDAMPGGGRLVIRTGRDQQGSVWLEVEDTGHGIPEEIRRRIFEPFFTTKPVGKGTGLGLSVVHGIVAQHHGRIELSSAEGGGTTFRIVLPPTTSGEFPAVSEAVVGDVELPSGNGERVLVVEDEEGAREALHEMLTALGYDVTSAGSGGAAGLLPLEPGFDLLLTDLMLPDFNGNDLAASLIERWPTLEVILMSGYTEDEAIRRGVGAGVVRFLQKPFDMKTLAREVRAALEA